MDCFFRSTSNSEAFRRLASALDDDGDPVVDAALRDVVSRLRTPSTLEDWSVLTEVNNFLFVSRQGRALCQTAL